MSKGKYFLIDTNPEGNNLLLKKIIVYSQLWIVWERIACVEET